MTIEYKIVNIIASTNIHEYLNLNKIAGSIEDTEYEPEIYKALIYRIKTPKCSILINSSGKIIFSGASSVKNIDDAKIILFQKLRSLGYTPIEDVILIQNIVLLVTISRDIDFYRISERITQLNGDSKYDESRFIFKNKNPRFTAIIFKSGKCLIAGLKNENAIHTVLKILNSISL